MVSVVIVNIRTILVSQNMSLFKREYVYERLDGPDEYMVESSEESEGETIVPQQYFYGKKQI